MRSVSAITLSLCLLLASSTVCVAQIEVVKLSDEEFAKLDTFEAHTLGKADKVFNERNYKQAGAEYDSFLLEFSKSPATPYALLRKARCLHYDGKRFEAIKEYTEVLDYFPNDIKFAGAALYYTGLAHWENGDLEKAMKAWAEMAEDKDYSKHPLAASAVNQLADNLVKQQKVDKAVQYYQQVAIDFRDTNPESARIAINKALPYMIRTTPDEAKVRAFWEKVRGFGVEPRKIEGDVAQDKTYWNQLRNNIEENGKFNQLQSDVATKYYGYWISQLENKFPDWDDYQIDLISYRFAVDKDPAQRVARLDQQFTAHQKPDDYGRVVRYIRAFGESNKAKVNEYYAKLDFAKMTNAQIIELIKTLADSCKEYEMAKNAGTKLRLSEMKDDERNQFVAGYLYHRDIAWTHDIAQAVCASFENKPNGGIILLRYYSHRGDAARGVPHAVTLEGDPTNVKEAFYLKGDLLDRSGKPEEAIKAYQQGDNPPTNLFRIADCYVRLGKLEQAVATLREIENFFKDSAPEAGIRVAHYYRDAGQKDKYISALRGVMKKYPESAPSSTAHQELEQLGVKIGGAVDAE